MAQKDGFSVAFGGDGERHGDDMPHVVAEATKSVVNSGEWFGVRGQVFDGLELLKAAEVWLLVNGRYVKCLPQTSWHERFWFHVRLGPGRYLLQVVGYKLMKEVEIPTKNGMFRRKKEYIVKSKTLRLLSIPKIINPNRMFPRAFEVENWRKITRNDVIPLTHKIVRYILKRYPDTSKIFLTGGLIRRGWTRRDIDFVVCSTKLSSEEGEHAYKFEKECEKIMNYPTSVFSHVGKAKYREQIYPEIAS